MVDAAIYKGDYEEDHEEGWVEPDVVVAAGSRGMPFSWSAAIAGVLAAVAVGFIIIALGCDSGLSSASSYGADPSGTTLTLATAVWLASSIGARAPKKIPTPNAANKGPPEAVADRTDGFFPADIQHCSGVARPGSKSGVDVVLFLKLSTRGVSLSAEEFAGVTPTIFQEGASVPTSDSEPRGEKRSLDSASAPAGAVLDALSVRQRDVLRLLVRGMSNKEIARALKLGEGTVKIHVAALFRKFGVRGRAAVAAEGARLLSKPVAEG
jgi:DNA-binding CsgD family transcriptional regulator